MNTAIIYFQKKVRIKINPIQNIMQYFDRIDVSEGTDFNKTIASKECDI